VATVASSSTAAALGDRAKRSLSQKAPPGLQRGKAAHVLTQKHLLVIWHGTWVEKVALQVNRQNAQNAISTVNEA
jgi:hypothetical protein